MPRTTTETASSQPTSVPRRSKRNGEQRHVMRREYCADSERFSSAIQLLLRHGKRDHAHLAPIPAPPPMPPLPPPAPPSAPAPHPDPNQTIDVDQSRGRMP